MAQSLAMLMAQAQGYAPLSPGVAPSNRTGFEGLAPAGAGPMAQLAAMGAAPFLQQQMHRIGMTPVGFGHDQNVYDTMRAMQFTQMQQQAMQAAAEADRANYLNIARGVAAASGTPFGADQYRAANAAIDPILAASPTLAQFAPGYLDALGGPRGSAVVLARRMVDAGRYRVDPVTGKTGMSAATVGATARGLFGDLYSDAAIAQMQGVTAGQLGGVFDVLQQRGMVRGLDSYDRRQAVLGMGGDLDAAARRQGVSLAGGAAALSGSDIDKLSADSAVADRLRALDVDKIKRTLKSYTGAVAAMKDIFGDAGRPDASMQELVQGLEALTAGSLGKIDPTRLGQIARQTYNLTKSAGVPLDQALVLQGDVAQRGQALGLESIFAVQAMQGAVGFGSAFRGTGQGAFASWGQMNADQITKLDANLRIQAAGSNAANRLNAAMRIRDTMGGFQQGSDAFLLTQAVAAGLDTFKDSTGTVRSVNMSERDFLRTMTGARGHDGRALGLGEADVRDLLSQRSTNREYGESYNTGAIVRRRQGADEVLPFLGNQLRNTLRSSLRGAFGDDELARSASGAASQRAITRIYGMSKAEFADTQRRNQRIGEILADELKGTAAGAKLAAMAPADREAFLTKTADRFYGAGNRALEQSPLRHFGGQQNVFDAVNEATLNQADAEQLRAKVQGQLQAAMTPIKPGSLVENLVTGLGSIDAGDPDAVAKLIATSLGGVATKDVAQAMLGPAQAVAQQKKTVEALQAKIRAEKDPTARAGLMKQLESAQRMLVNQTNDLANFAARAGLPGAGVDSSQIQKAGQAGAEVLRAQAALQASGGGAKTKAFLAGVDGARFRADVSTAAQSYDAVAQGLIATPGAVRRLGTRALDLHESLTGDQQRLRDLAGAHAGGDVARLLAGDFDPGVTNPAALKQETFAIQRRQQQIAAELAAAEGATGKRWRPDKEEAMRLLGFRPGSSLTPAQQREVDKLSQDVGLARRLTPAQELTLAGKDPKALAALAGELGVDKAALNRAGGVLDRLVGLQGAALARNAAPGQDVAAQILESFGIHRPDGMVTAQQRELGRLIEGSGGRGLARRVLESQGLLRTVARQGGGRGLAGVDAMVAEYSAAMDGDPKSRQRMIAAFQTKYGLDHGPDGARRWSDLGKAIQFQKQTDFLRFGGEGRKLRSDEDVLRLFGAGLKGEMAPREPAAPAGTATAALGGRITGELRIVGDRGDLSATMGGTRSAVIG